jgi:signal peptidase I
MPQLDPYPLAPAVASDAAALPVLAPPRGEARARARYPRVASALRGVLKLGAMLAVLTLARATLADQYVVPTGSMWPTIAPGDRIFVDKVAYGLHVPLVGAVLGDRGGPPVGDVVLLGDPRGGSIPLVKRVVARGGQRVAMHDGVLFVDGQAQALEPAGGDEVVERLGGVEHAGTRDTADFGPIVVPPDHVFVMGDNRSVSLDSRVLGSVPRELVRGHVVGVIYRLDRGRFDVSRLFHAIR